MKNVFARFVKDESGATAIEYGLIAAILSVAIITILQSVGGELSSTYTKINSALSTANGG
ncbi:MAG: Flp family type IVb pilin [Hyphomicrobiaceae bacterium]|nr:Flp family type IVb pilin [Hyphomicrobiaceae bacterium]